MRPCDSGTSGFFFFFSSRRRHTSLVSDWSSDVCSSDLLGLVPQDLAFYPTLSARENLRFFGAVQGLAAARLVERIDAVTAFARLEGVLERRAGELSGGLKRRLNLAIGLLADPPILLLDEPTVGVDAQSRAFL